LITNQIDQINSPDESRDSLSATTAHCGLPTADWKNMGIHNYPDRPEQQLRKRSDQQSTTTANCQLPTGKIWVFITTQIDQSTSPNEGPGSPSAATADCRLPTADCQTARLKAWGNFPFFM